MLLEYCNWSINLPPFFYFSIYQSICWLHSPPLFILSELNSPRLSSTPFIHPFLKLCDKFLTNFTSPDSVYDLCTVCFFLRLIIYFYAFTKFASDTFFRHSLIQFWFHADYLNLSSPLTDFNLRSHDSFIDQNSPSMIQLFTISVEWCWTFIKTSPLSCGLCLLLLLFITLSPPILHECDVGLLLL